MKNEEIKNIKSAIQENGFDYAMESMEFSDKEGDTLRDKYNSARDNLVAYLAELGIDSDGSDFTSTPQPWP